MIEIRVKAEVSDAAPVSKRVCQVAAMFGLPLGAVASRSLVPPLALKLGRSRITFITGASGSGKTTLLRQIQKTLENSPGVRLIPLDTVRLDEARPVIDQVGKTLEEAVRCLSLAGLSEAPVMMRRAGELSEGQRRRLRLALALDLAERAMAEAERVKDFSGEAAAGPVKGFEATEGVKDFGGAARVKDLEEAGGVKDFEGPAPVKKIDESEPRGRLVVILGDEFGASLDRITAMVLARQARKWADRSGVCFLLAGAHEDVIEALRPDVVVELEGEGVARVYEQGA